MRILMVNGPDALRFRGGDLVQMRKTAESLRRHGVEVIESFDAEPDGRGFDLAHVFNLRTVTVTPGQVRTLKKFGLPVVLSPIYIDPSLAIWGTQALESIFHARHSDHERERLLQQFATRQLWLKNSAGQTVTPHGPNRPRADFDQLQRDILAQIDYLLPNSVLEMDQLTMVLQVGDLPFAVVPYAVDAAVFRDADPEAFVRIHGRRDFVLQVGRLEPSKNQLMLAAALRDSDLLLVLIGGLMNPNYTAAVRQFGPRDLHIIDHLPPDELRAAYAAARVHVLPSWAETCGLVSLEAALADCSLVVSSAGHEREYFRDEADYCDPADIESIRAAVLTSYSQYDRAAARRARLRDRILRDYTWDRAAAVTFEAYQRVLNADEQCGRVSGRE